MIWTSTDVPVEWGPSTGVPYQWGEPFESELKQWLDAGAMTLASILLGIEQAARNEGAILENL